MIRTLKGTGLTIAVRGELSVKRGIEGLTSRMKRSKEGSPTIENIGLMFIAVVVLGIALVAIKPIATNAFAAVSTKLNALLT